MEFKDQIEQLSGKTTKQIEGIENIFKYADKLKEGLDLAVTSADRNK